MPIRVYYEVLNQKGTPALYSDNYAQRPAAGFQGRIFNSPDTGQIFYDTGTTWTLLADAGVGSGSLASVCANGNTTATGISITAGGLSTNDFTNTGFASSVGYVWFAGTGGQMTGTQSFFWDNNNKWLGLGTNTPTAPFDIHTTGNIGIQINNTTTADSKIAFLNADVGKWRIGNLYSGGANLFHIYNNAGSTLAMQINSSNAALFYGSLSANSFIQTNGGISLIHNSVPTSTGYTGIGGLTAGLSIALATGFNQTLTFPTGVAYTYTFPSATGTIALTSNLSSYLPLTGGTLTGDLNGTSSTFTKTSATNQCSIIATGNNIALLQLSGNNKGWNLESNRVANAFTIYESGVGSALTILSGGNIGINTTSPTEKLDVVGGALAAGNGTIRTGITYSSLGLIGTFTNHSLGIITNGTERMRVRSDGNVAIADSGNASVRFIVQGASSSSGDYAFISYNSSSTTLLALRNDGAIFLNTFTYNNTVTGGVRTLYIDNTNALGGISSIRESKKNINNISNVDWLYQLNPVTFNYRKKDINGNYLEEYYDDINYGLIAEDTRNVADFLCNYDDNKLKGIEYSRLITPLLVSAISHEERIKALEQKLN